MTSSPPVYTEASQIADTHLEKAIVDLKDQVVRGFEAVNKRLDDVVIKQTFDQTVARLDEKIEHTDERLRSDVKQVASRVDQVGTTTKWALGFGLTGAGIISGVVFGIVSALQP